MSKCEIVLKRNIFKCPEKLALTTSTTVSNLQRYRKYLLYVP